MKQGLLFKESPENRVELFCASMYQDNEAKKKNVFKVCNKQFFDEQSFEQHQLEFHKCVWASYLDWHKPCWYNIENRDMKSFTELRFQLPIRPIRRWNVTQEMIDNLLVNRNCWCGIPRKEFDKFQVKYCTEIHNKKWWELTNYPNWHRDLFLSNHDNYCDKCGKKVDNVHAELEMDHIIALIFGGHAWDNRNLQGLCRNCHKEKTKSDVGILAHYRRISNYDTGQLAPDPQLLLESFIRI